MSLLATFFPIVAAIAGTERSASASRSLRLEAELMRVDREMAAILDQAQVVLTSRERLQSELRDARTEAEREVGQWTTH